MNGFADHGLNEKDFGEKGNIVAAFDAFRMWFRLDDPYLSAFCSLIQTHCPAKLDFTDAAFPHD